MNVWTAAGAVAFGGMAIGAWGAVYPGSQLFGPTLRVTDDSSTVALTFDDGPNPAATPALLDLLDAYDARATFFLMGRHVRAFPALARHGVDGHQLDASAMTIRLFERLGWATRVRWPDRSRLAARRR